jgi:hypothetical protein
MRVQVRIAVVTILILALVPFADVLAQARIVEWVENAPVSDNDRIALGYPVPIPVDTPMPFAGYRTYNGLHARHQDLANTSDWSHAIELGQTTMGRTIWLYQLGDADRTTVTGLPEHAMLTNGGIHAREWQSPEVATGIIELLAEGEDDDFLLGYLRDNANILVIPVLNVDGFLQTQRYPSTNWLGTDLNDPEESPRDGRMRRKNMLGADEILMTQGDHLEGVDLNRNNAPYWASTPDRSSDDSRSLVHHGAGPASEPEIKTLDAAVQYAPAEKLSMYTDLHSYSQVHFWSRNDNFSLARETSRLLGTFTNHHVAFDAGKYYWYPNALEAPKNEGIGLTEEYFTNTYQVPSWTLEIEPTFGNHDGLPGKGEDYGGLNRNGHSGFIMPDSEVPRVRTELAQSFMMAYYQQSGPPSIAAIRFIDVATGAVVMESEWDVTSDVARKLYSFQSQPLQFDREYRFWAAFDKPMRWREDGEVVPLPGQPGSKLDIDAELIIEGGELEIMPTVGFWADQPGDAPGGYMHYRDDALNIGFSIPGNDNNMGLVEGVEPVTLSLNAWDMTGTRLDANPATVARWVEGSWSGYEDSDGEDRNNEGGYDETTQFNVTSEALGDPFVIEPGISAAWFDPKRNGEGFMIEILDNDQAVMYWFTYDTEGNQDWYVAQGEVRGNRILFPELIQVSGGEFGPGFDPGNVTNKVVGSATFIWADCGNGSMEWVIDSDGGERRSGRMDLQRVTYVMGFGCGRSPLPPETPAGILSGSWYDPSHAGEGYVLEILIHNTALVYWFSFDAEGNRRWFFGTGQIQGDKLAFDDMLTTSGGVFGEGFDPNDVEVSPWGSLEMELACDTGSSSFVPTEDGFPAGELDLTRLTYLSGLSCGMMEQAR